MQPYRQLFDKVLTRTDPEKAHHIAFRAIRAAQPVTRLVGGRTQGGPLADRRVMGLEFPGLLGLAAGFDKNGVGIDALANLGFGFVEIGTVTGEPQPGNPKPRLARLPADRAIVNRMGFNNDGAEVVSRRLAARSMDRTGRRLGTPLGINIGKTKVVPEDGAVRDYEKSTTLLAPFADYLVVNVSSPNTPGLRDLQVVSRLEPLLRAVRRRADDVTDRHVPLLVKIAPDLSDEDVLEVADLASRSARRDRGHQHDDRSRRSGLDPPTGGGAGAGGLSGPPLRARATEVIRLLRQRIGPEMTLVGAAASPRPGTPRAARGGGRPAAGLHRVRLRGPLVARPDEPRDRGAARQPDRCRVRSSTPGRQPFGARLRIAMDGRGPLCAGIDPHAGLLEDWGLTDSVNGLERFALGAAEALAPQVAAVKPQSAFFERFGSRGIAVLERVIATSREAGALVVLDVKRGDIGSTAQAYADAYLDPRSPLAVDAITASPYLGFGSLDPMLTKAREHGKGVFVLALTSNPEAPQVQHARTEAGAASAAPCWTSCGAQRGAPRRWAPSAPSSARRSARPARTSTSTGRCWCPGSGRRAAPPTTYAASSATSWTWCCRRARARSSAPDRTRGGCTPPSDGRWTPSPPCGAAGDPRGRARRSVVALVVALLLPLAACGGDDSASYCSDLRKDRKEIADMLDSGSPRRCSATCRCCTTSRTSPRRDLADEWQTFVGRPGRSRRGDRRRRGEAVGLQGRQAARRAQRGGEEVDRRRRRTRSRTEAVVQAASGIEQQARDVCKINLGI